MAEVLLLAEAASEFEALPPNERVAMAHAIQKLHAMGENLPFPHQSAVRGAAALRELRPRGGRSRWRAFYRRVGDDFVIGGIGPEAGVDHPAFERAVRRAVDRLDGFAREPRNEGDRW